MSISVENILDKLRPIREQGFPKVYSGDEYVELVQSLGVSEQEWGQLQEGFYEYLEKSKTYLKDNELENALLNIEKALLIRPNDVDTLSAISEIYLRRWQEKGDTHSFEKADYFANRCLMLKPEHEASQTRLAVLHPKVMVRKSNPVMTVLMVVIALLVVMTVAVVVFVLMHGSGGGPGVHY